MKISSIATMVLLLMFLVYALTFFSLGINVVTLPWLTLMTFALAFALVFALFGRYLLPAILRKFGVKVWLGDCYIDDKYFIITNFDAEGGARYAGFSVIKLIPTTPSVDLKEEDKKLLLRNVESLILSLPSDIEYGVFKIVDPSIKKLLKKIESEIRKYQSRQVAAGRAGQKYERKIAELERERERILKSNPVSGIIFIKVFAKGRDPEEVKQNLNKLIQQVESLAHSIQCTTKVLSGFDLYDFVETELLSRVVRYV